MIFYRFDGSSPLLPFQILGMRIAIKVVRSEFAPMAVRTIRNYYGMPTLFLQVMGSAQPALLLALSLLEVSAEKKTIPTKLALPYQLCPLANRIAGKFFLASKGALLSRWSVHCIPLPKEEFNF